MSFEVTFEIGHTVCTRNHITPEGFTHDWELQVRGEDNHQNISRFVNKVVFNLHNSYEEPKRTVENPPYVVKESGYAGFYLDIDIYFKGQCNDPEKATFNYDLSLPSLYEGPMTMKQRRKYIFQNPSPNFRQILVESLPSTSELSEKESEDESPSNSQRKIDADSDESTSDSSKNDANELLEFRTNNNTLDSSSEGDKVNDGTLIPRSESTSCLDYNSSQRNEFTIRK